MTARLEEIVPGVRLQGVVPGESLEVLGTRWHGADSLTVTYRSAAGLGQSVVYRGDESSLDVDSGERRPFDADPDDFKVAAEAQRIRLAGVHDPMLAVATSAVRPLPHQIRAVYGEMLPRRPLRFLLADDPGAGKTIMAGLLIKELLLREDVRRCLVVAPGGLVDQWQEELQEKFGLAFSQLSTAGADGGRTALSSDTLLLARMDQLARNDDLLAELEDTSWDLVVVDEAHRMGAHWYGNTLDTTRRFQLGERLGQVTRHLLLMTATPHSGIEDDFQAFLSLLDRDAFTGRAGPGHRRADTERVMRRMLKEDLLTFEGKPLFPERRAQTVPYALTAPEQDLYDAVTAYVREGMNRAERLEDPRRRTVGFALTVLQRRLASSPAAIHASLQRRAARLRARAQDLADGVGLEPTAPAGRQVPRQLLQALEEDQGDLAAEELEEVEGELVDAATAARTEAELRTEVAELDALIEVASDVRRGGNDVKWSELRSILQDNVLMMTGGEARKLIIFTEHRDTLDYLVERISTLIGIPDAVEAIHGGVSRAERRRIATEFTNNPATRVLVATDAAGEGLNLQAAHLMVNYDLPWNPNRIEQRFGRIHRIGQREVCRLWNLVAVTTREGQVFERLLTKIEEQRLAYGGKIFDVLGGDVFENRALRDVLMDAIRYGDRSDVRQRMDQTIDAGVAQGLDELVAERALASEMRPADVEAIRAQMDQARVRRLQPHYIEMAFRAGLERLGGRMARRERGRFQITRVPPTLLTHGTAVARAYERVTFDLEGVDRDGTPRAELLAPGHPLHDEVMRACLQRWGPALERGTVLISPDVSEPRLLVGVLEEVVDGTGESVARRFGYAVADADGRVEAAGVAAPYLDGIAVAMDSPVAQRARALPWLAGAESAAESWLIAHDLPRFLREVAPAREAEIDQTRLAVSSRLRAEINRLGSESLAAGEAERSGKRPRDSAESLLRRAGELEVRLDARLALLDRQRAMRTPPPALTAAAILVPVSWAAHVEGDLPEGLPAGEEELAGEQADPEFGVLGRDLVDRRAVDAVLAAERTLGRTPTEQPHHNKGFDIRSVTHDGPVGAALLIEVKGRIAGARTVHVSYSQVMTAKNTAADHRLALVRVDPRGAQHDDVRYLERAFASVELDSLFVAGIELDWDKAWARARPPF